MAEGSRFRRGIFVETLLQTLRNLGPMRLSIMGGVVFGLGMIVILFAPDTTKKKLTD